MICVAPTDASLVTELCIGARRDSLLVVCACLCEVLPDAGGAAMLKPGEPRRRAVLEASMLE
jgi:hypothetical protein